MKDLTICLIESIQSTIAVFKNANVLVDDRKRIWFAILNLEGTLEPLKLKCMLQEDLTSNLSIYAFNWTMLFQNNMEVADDGRNPIESGLGLLQHF